ncbi:hypothetical protein J2Z42_001565 [Clostridium algifaecis]|uniref:Uncharacterized protein n=1 Tax=Clostridium algifaecis TaxID=1472040 RepID=A0ABS4KU33_9CLOT|nr:hypothetical protein [Clostridium algifaecis]MBP2032886.1 hypothetical protein [Clostridium algifaecis]
MKLKTLLFTGLIATMVATPVFAYQGHGIYTNEYNTKQGMCGNYGPEHSVKLGITHNRSANQTYALASCGCYGHGVGTKVILSGNEQERHSKNYVQTTSLCAPGTLTASEIHRVDY